MSGSEWLRIKLKYLVSLQSGEAIDGKDIKDESLYPVYGGNGLRGYTDRFTHEGHRILIGRQGTLCGNVNYAEGQFWATEHAIVATPRREFNTIWLGEALRAMNLNQYSQSAAQPGIAVEVIENLEVLVPPLETQKKIANQLSSRLAQVDGLIHAKQRLLDLLTEKRRSLIANAVTRGLNADVPMRDSGIDWLGQIPAHWDTQRAKVLFREIDERSTLGDETLLSLRMEKGLVPHNDVSTKLIPTSELIGYKRARAGQIVVNRMRAASGLIAVVPQDGIVSPDYAVFEATGFISPEYFALLFQTTLLQAVFRSESKGLGTGQSGFLRLYSENFLALYFPLPPFDEQQTIVVRTQIEAKKLNDFAAATERTITLLNERRTALIARAVIGQE